MAKWLEENQVVLLIFATIGLKFTIYYAIKLAIKLYPALCCRRKRFEWAPYENQFAVVTGATDGLGYQFALQLAQKNYNLMLISKNEQKLERTRRQILQSVSNRPAALDSVNTVNSGNGPPPSQYPIQIRTLAVDFSHLYVYKKVEQFLATQQNEIAVLVNNVGISTPIPDRFVAEDAVTHQEILNVNIMATTKMLEMVLPSMVRRKRGGLVINVASLTGKHLSPLTSLFSASKSYIAHLSESLAEEHREDDITFCTLYPLSVSTKMNHYAEVGSFTPSPEEYVKRALASIKHRGSLSTTGFWSHSAVDGMLSLITHIASRQTAASFMKSNNETDRKQLLETNASNRANGQTDLGDGNVWRVLS